MPRKKTEAVVEDAVEVAETPAVEKEVKIPLPSANLPIGSRAHGFYKKQRVDLEVIDVNGEPRYRITPDGSDHTSLSAATKAATLVLNPGLDPKSAGSAVALTKWWSLDELGEGAVRERVARTPSNGSETSPRKRTSKRSVTPTLKRMRQQDGAPDGKIRWYCSACQDGFLADWGEEPAACPNGHDKFWGSELDADGVADESPTIEPVAAE